MFGVLKKHAKRLKALNVLMHINSLNYTMIGLEKKWQ